MMDVYMTLTEVATLTRLSKPTLTRLSKPTLYRYVHEGQIPHLKLGTRLLFEPQELKQWLNQKRKGIWTQEVTK
jgi:excisionase family DNA binding protein